MGKVFREALWWMWEQPRLPRPLIKSKYPARYPWSPGARAVIEAVGPKGSATVPGGGLVLEHLIPANLFANVAIDSAPSLGPEGLLGLLADHGVAVVVSKDEDLVLTRAGLANRMPEGWDGQDLWARPRAAGLAVEAFGALAPTEEATVEPN